jgi:hypothetical protein
MTLRRMGGHLASAVVGAIIGGVLVLAVDGFSRTVDDPPRRAVVQSPSPSQDSQPEPDSLSVPVAARPRGVLLAWAPPSTIGLPPRIDRQVEALPNTGNATLVRAGLDWIRSTHLPDGTTVDSPPNGMLIPFEVAVVKPNEYARFVPPSERQLITALRPGELLLAETEAEIRQARVGMRLKLLGRTMRVTGVVSDIATNGYEAIMRAPIPASWNRADEFLLVRNQGARRARIEQFIRARLNPGQRLQVRLNNEQPFLRYGDAVHPQLMIKKAFGEFAARPLPTGYIVIDPHWLAANIRTARVPILGRVSCHRALFPQLRAALSRVQAEGIAHLINPNDFAGCFGPRFVSRDPDGRLSHHAWGVAFDINAAENRPGYEPNLSRRVVAVIEDFGFTWGGRWIIPDGMHFEWQTWGPG